MQRYMLAALMPVGAVQPLENTPWTIPVATHDSLTAPRALAGPLHKKDVPGVGMQGSDEKNPPPPLGDSKALSGYHSAVSDDGVAGGAEGENSTRAQLTTCSLDVPSRYLVLSREKVWHSRAALFE